MSKSYAEQISAAQVMSAGLHSHAAEVARRGLDEAFLTDLDANVARSVQLNAEQEKLKSDLKAKTAELELTLSETAKQVSEGKKIVKMDYAKTQWAEFGITDKQ